MNHPYHRLLTGNKPDVLEFTRPADVLEFKLPDSPTYHVHEALTARERKNFMAQYRRAVTRQGV